jgi:hypothetical protein
VSASIRTLPIWLWIALVTASASSAQNYYSVTGGGGQTQIGDGLPLPIQVNRTLMGGPIGTGTMLPPLLIPVNPDPAKAIIKQTGAAPAQMKLQPGVLRRVPGSPKVIGLAANNPKVLQVKTRISFSGPANVKGTMTFKKDGVRTKALSFAGAPAGAVAFYSGSINRFGGPSQMRVAVLSEIGVWLNVAAMLPCKHPAFGGANGSCVAPLVPVYPASLAAAGGAMTMAGKVTAGVTVTTPGGPPAKSPGVVALSIPNSTGLIAKSANLKNTGSLTNMATSVGFPWTTGKVVLSQPSALAAFEKFTVTGKDSRSAMGVGTISLVSGALSNRKLSGPNANKSWARYTLPEPGVALGAAAALAALALGHALARRRSS